MVQIDLLVDPSFILESFIMLLFWLDLFTGSATKCNNFIDIRELKVGLLLYIELRQIYSSVDVPQMLAL